MIRSLTLAATALSLTALVAPAGAAPASPPAHRGVGVVVQKDGAGDVRRGVAWKSASVATRKASDLRRTTVGDSPRGAQFVRFTWTTKALQARRKDVARTYSIRARTPETNESVEVRLVQVNKVSPEALLFVDGDTSECLYAKGAPPLTFSSSTRTVSLDIRDTCLSTATGGETGLELRSASVTTARERAAKDLVIGTDTVRFAYSPQVNF